jgi:hypothetical protein
MIPQFNPSLWIGKKVLLTVREWFYAPDGKSYKAVHGTLKAAIPTKDVFGFTTNAHTANFMVEIGDVMVMGCQILYAVKCETVIDEPKENWVLHEGEIKIYTPPYSSIYKTA